MDARFAIEREQTLNYVKARLARLGERKIDLELHYQGAQGHQSYQMKVVDYKIDRMLELLHELESAEDARAGSVRPPVLATF